MRRCSWLGVFVDCFPFLIAYVTYVDIVGVVVYVDDNVLMMLLLPLQSSVTAVLNTIVVVVIVIIVVVVVATVVVVVVWTKMLRPPPPPPPPHPLQRHDPAPLSFVHLPPRWLLPPSTSGRKHVLKLGLRFSHALHEARPMLLSELQLPARPRFLLELIVCSWLGWLQGEERLKNAERSLFGKRTRIPLRGQREEWNDGSTDDATFTFVSGWLRSDRC